MVSSLKINSKETEHYTPDHLEKKRGEKGEK
jgi:hypothetical protein